MDHATSGSSIAGDATAMGPVFLGMLAYYVQWMKKGEGSAAPLSRNAAQPTAPLPVPTLNFQPSSEQEVEAAMADKVEDLDVVRHQRDQMLKLVTKGFFNELLTYGVDRKEVVRVASHLLDNLLSRLDLAENGVHYYSDLFNLKTVKDEWRESTRLSVDHVSLRPLQQGTTSLVARWLSRPQVRHSFIPPFPAEVSELEAYFVTPGCAYFEILHQSDVVGIIGGENIDTATGRLEMKKLVGDSAQQGKGIGKRATFAFLYYAFMILGINKVYIHALDINIRNIGLNNRFGFELEGVFREDLLIEGKRTDVVRMALMRKTWLEIFSAGGSAWAPLAPG